ncbi:MAG: isoprenylcysteine carboxylmethyltransferase family protein [Ktedonobacteraceae bacterium]
MNDIPRDNAGVIAPPPLIFAGGLLLGLLLHRRFPARFLPHRQSRILSGGLLVALAALLVQQAFGEMQRVHTSPNPHETVTEIVIDGPYRLSRNPIYLAFTLFYTGIAVLVNSLWTMLLLPLVLFIMLRGVIEREERYLERKFGEKYLLYKESVRRWI